MKSKTFHYFTKPLNRYKIFFKGGYLDLQKMCYLLKKIVHSIHGQQGKTIKNMTFFFSFYGLLPVKKIAPRTA